jgi:hypothetical protein
MGGASFGVWILGFLWDLDFGFWSFGTAGESGTHRSVVPPREVRNGCAVTSDLELGAWDFLAEGKQGRQETQGRKGERGKRRKGAKGV